MPPKNKKKQPPQQASETTEVSNKHNTRSTTKGVAVSSKNSGGYILYKLRYMCSCLLFLPQRVALQWRKKQARVHPVLKEVFKFNVTTEQAPKWQGPNPKKTTAQGVKKVTNGHSMAPPLDNADKDKCCNDSIGEGEQTCRDSPEKGRSTFHA